MKFRENIISGFDLAEKVSERKFVGFRPPEAKQKAFDTIKAEDGSLRLSIRPDTVRRILSEMTDKNTNG